MKTILSISFKNIFFHKFQFFSWNAIKNKILNIFEKKMQILFFTSGFDFHEKYLLNIVIGVNIIWYFYVRGALSLKPHLLFFWRGGGMSGGVGGFVPVTPAWEFHPQALVIFDCSLKPGASREALVGVLVFQVCTFRPKNWKNVPRYTFEDSKKIKLFYL